MRRSVLHHFVTLAGLAVAITEAAGVVITIVEAIQRDPKDGVLLFEFLALLTFFLGIFFVKLAGFVCPVVIVRMVFFIGFIFAAAYFALINWRPTKRAH